MRKSQIKKFKSGKKSMDVCNRIRSALLVGIALFLCIELCSAQERPERGKITYEGTYSGRAAEGFLFLAGSDIEGAITLTVDFDGPAVRARYTTTGKLPGGAVTGLVSGINCRLTGNKNLTVEGECTEAGFNGTLISQPVPERKTTVKFRLTAKGEVSGGAQRPVRSVPDGVGNSAGGGLRESNARSAESAPPTTRESGPPLQTAGGQVAAAGGPTPEQTWNGRSRCGRFEVPIRLEIQTVGIPIKPVGRVWSESSVTARFTWGELEKPFGIAQLKGTYGIDTKQLQFREGEWIIRPTRAGVLNVLQIDGVISKDNQVYKGASLAAVNCGEFSMSADSQVSERLVADGQKALDALLKDIAIKQEQFDQRAKEERRRRGLPEEEQNADANGLPAESQVRCVSWTYSYDAAGRRVRKFCRPALRPGGEIEVRLPANILAENAEITKLVDNPPDPESFFKYQVHGPMSAVGGRGLVLLGLKLGQSKSEVISIVRDTYGVLLSPVAMDAGAVMLSPGDIDTTLEARFPLRSAEKDAMVRLFFTKDKDSTKLSGGRIIFTDRLVALSVLKRRFPATLPAVVKTVEDKDYGQIQLNLCFDRKVNLKVWTNKDRSGRESIIIDSEPWRTDESNNYVSGCSNAASSESPNFVFLYPASPEQRQKIDRQLEDRHGRFVSGQDAKCLAMNLDSERNESECTHVYRGGGRDGECARSTDPSLSTYLEVRNQCTRRFDLRIVCEGLLEKDFGLEGGGKVFIGPITTRTSLFSMFGITPGAPTDLDGKIAACILFHQKR
jgi:YD repeat-containing protein